jgi:hypothetical protein
MRTDADDVGGTILTTDNYLPPAYADLQATKFVTPG